MLQPQGVQPVGGPSRVFVVEDEALIALDLLDRLRGLGYEPCGHAAGSADARRLIPTARPDVVLMDVNLGVGPDGVDTSELLRLECDAPVVFLTAYSDSELLDRAARATAAGYVLKPFEDRDLRVAIDLAIARQKAGRREVPADLDIITTCMGCRKVRVRRDRWGDIEALLAARLGIRFSHGYCPACYEVAIAALEQPGPGE